MSDGAGEAAVVREATAADWEVLQERFRRSWGSMTIISRGRELDVADLPAMVCEIAGELCGLATYALGSAECELVSLDAYRPRAGIGSALLAAVAGRARAAGCSRLWLVTSNDNLEALRFYQRRGLRLVAVHRDGADEARRLKPSIPRVGDHGIEIHDELELELDLDRAALRR